MRLLLGAMAISLALPPDLAPADTVDPPFPAWSQLRFTADAVPLFSGHLDMQVETASGEKTALETSVAAAFLGVRIAASETRTIMDRKTGLPSVYESRNEKSARRFTFGSHGYTFEKLEPAENADGPLDEWTVYFSSEFPYPDDGDGGTVPVHDYYGMLLNLRNANLEKPGDEITVWVATSDGAAAYRVQVAEARVTDWTYRSRRLDQRRTGPVRQLRLRLIPADPERVGGGFLEMEGETQLWVEADSKTVLELSGKVPKVPGRVRVVLTEVD